MSTVIDNRPMTSGTPDAGASDHIGELRTRIDTIDNALIELWRERAAISSEVGRVRIASGGTRLVLAREREIVDRFRDALGADGVQLALLILRAGRGPL
jgi:chorismate mutase